MNTTEKNRITKEFIDQYCKRLGKDIKFLQRERDDNGNIVSWAQDQIDVLNEAIAYCINTQIISLNRPHQGK